MTEEERVRNNRAYLLLGATVLLAAYLLLRVAWDPRTWWSHMLAGYVFAGVGFLTCMFLIPKIVKTRLYFAQHFYMAVCVPIGIPFAMTILCRWYAPEDVFPATCLVNGAASLFLARFAP